MQKEHCTKHRVDCPRRHRVGDSGTIWIFTKTPVPCSSCQAKNDAVIELYFKWPSKVSWTSVPPVNYRCWVFLIINLPRESVWSRDVPTLVSVSGLILDSITRIQKHVLIHVHLFIGTCSADILSQSLFIGKQEAVFSLKCTNGAKALLTFCSVGYVYHAGRCMYCIPSFTAACDSSVSLGTFCLIWNNLFPFGLKKPPNGENTTGCKTDNSYVSLMFSSYSNSLGPDTVALSLTWIFASGRQSFSRELIRQEVESKAGDVPQDVGHASSIQTTHSFALQDYSNTMNRSTVSLRGCLTLQADLHQVSG